MNETTGVGEAAAPPSTRTLKSYTQAFPDADAEALAAHLAVTSTAGLVTRTIEAEIQRLGFDLSRPRYTIVRSLYLGPAEGMAQSDLAQALRVSGPNVTQLIDGLVSEGWVERVINPADRRVVHARLTQEGKKRASKLVPAIVEFMEDSVRGLTAEEQAELRRLLDKVRLSVEAVRS